MSFQLTSTQSGSVVIIKAAGKLDAQAAPQLSDLLKQNIGAGHTKIVLDCSGLSYIASAGLGVLNANRAEAVKGKGGIRLAGVTPQVKDVFDLMKFSALFPMFPSAQEALTGF